MVELRRTRGSVIKSIRYPSADPLSSCAQKSLGIFAMHLPQARGNKSGGANHETTVVLVFDNG
jgi:hypothetical protein